MIVKQGPILPATTWPDRVRQSGGHASRSPGTWQRWRCLPSLCRCIDGGPRRCCWSRSCSIVPGVLLLRALRVPGGAVAASPVYVPCASLIVLLASGLAVNLAGPLIGVAAPLRPVPLLIGLEIICARAAACSVNAPAETEIPWGLLSRPMRLAWPLILPLVAAAGALRLNSGHGNTIALIALATSRRVARLGLLLRASP